MPWSRHRAATSSADGGVDPWPRCGAGRSPAAHDRLGPGQVVVGAPPWSRRSHGVRRWRRTPHRRRLHPPEGSSSGQARGQTLRAAGAKLEHVLVLPGDSSSPGQGDRALRRRPRPGPGARRGGRPDGRRPGPRFSRTGESPGEDGRGGAGARPPGARRTHRHRPTRTRVRGHWSSGRWRSSARSTACSTTPSASRRWTRSPAQARGPARGQRDQRVRPAAALGAVRGRAGRRSRGRSSCSTPACCTVPARVRRLQAVQGHPRAPRLLAGHRAGAARDPGQQRRTVATSTRTSTRPTSTGSPRSPAVTHEDIYAERPPPTDLKRLASPEEVANATLFLACDLASAVTGVC